MYDNTYHIKIQEQTTIVIKPKSKAEEEFLAHLLKKMNVEAHLVEDDVPNYESRKAIADVEQKNGWKSKIFFRAFHRTGNLMFHLVYTSKFRKDVKVLKKRGLDPDILKMAIISLENSGELLAAFWPHKL